MPRRLVLPAVALGAVVVLVGAFFVGRAVASDGDPAVDVAAPTLVDVAAARALLGDDPVEPDDPQDPDADPDGASADAGSEAATGGGAAEQVDGAALLTGALGADVQSGAWQPLSPLDPETLPAPEDLREMVPPEEQPPHIPDGPIILGDPDAVPLRDRVVDAGVAGEPVSDPGEADDAVPADRAAGTDGPPGVDGDGLGADAEELPRFVDLCLARDADGTSPDGDADEAEGSPSGGPAVPDAAFCPEGHGGTIQLAMDGDPGAPVVVTMRARTVTEEDRVTSPRCVGDADLADDEVMVEIGLSRPADLLVEWTPLLRGIPFTPRTRTLELAADADQRSRFDERRAAEGFDPAAPDNTWTCVVLDAPIAGYWIVEVTAFADDGGVGSARSPLTSAGWTPDRDEREQRRGSRTGARGSGPVSAQLVEIVPITDTRAALYLLDRFGRPGGFGTVAALPRSGINATDMSCREWERRHEDGDRSWDDRDQIIEQRRGRIGVAAGTGVGRADRLGNRETAEQRYALLRPRHGVTYELCVRRLAGSDSPYARGINDVMAPSVRLYDRGSLTFSLPRFARPRIEVVATESVPEPGGSVIVRAANWGRPATLVLEDVPAGRTVRDDLGPPGTEFQRVAGTSQDEVPEVTHLVVRNGDTGATFETFVPTPSRACAGPNPFCATVSPTRFVMVPIPLDEPTRSEGVDQGAGVVMLQVTMEDHPTSDTHSTEWSIAEQMFTFPGPTPPEPGPEPELVSIRWGLANPGSRLLQSPGGETVNVAWTFDRPMLGATVESHPASLAPDVPEECRRGGTIERDAPGERLVLRVEQLCPGHSTRMWLLSVTDADGVVHELDPGQRYRSTAYLWAPPQTTREVVELEARRADGRGPVGVTGPRVTVGDRTYRRSGGASPPLATEQSGCSEAGWSSGQRSAFGTWGGADTASAVDVELASAWRLPSCDYPFDGSADLERFGPLVFSTVLDGPLAPRQSAAERAVHRRELGGADRVEVLLHHTRWLDSMPHRDVWRDRNVPGGPLQYVVMEPLVCPPAGSDDPCRVPAEGEEP